VTVLRQKQSPAARTGLNTHIGGYRMVPQLIARVDGLPVSLVTPERVWPVPSAEVGDDVSHDRARLAPIERQTAVVHECRLPAWARDMLAEQAAESERFAIRSDLPRAGLL